MTTIEALQQQVAEAEEAFKEARAFRDFRLGIRNRAWQTLKAARKSYAAAVKSCDKSVAEFRLAHDLWQTALRELDEATGKDAKVTA